MPEQFLHRANVVPIFQEMGGEAVAHHMRAEALREASLSPRSSHRLLDDRLVQVIPRWPPVSGIPADPSRRKHELPPPLGRRVGKLAVQRERQDDPSEPARQIPLMQAAHVGQVPRQGLPRRYGQHRHPILSNPSLAAR